MIAERMEECRRTMREILGVEYGARTEEMRRVITAIATEQGGGAVSAAVTLLRRAEEKAGGSDLLTIMVCAVTYDLMKEGVAL